jgi:hypothetical protein
MLFIRRPDVRGAVTSLDTRKRRAKPSTKPGISAQVAAKD